MELIQSLRHWTKYKDGDLTGLSLIITNKTINSCEYIINIVSLFNFEYIRLYPLSNGSMCFYFSIGWYPNLIIHDTRYTWELSESSNDRYRGYVKDFNIETLMLGVKQLLQERKES